MSKRRKRLERLRQNPTNVSLDDLRHVLEYYLALPYTIELTPDKDGFWFAEIPLLEGCITNGSNREDALVMIDDAKRAWLETAITLGLSIPEPEREEA